MPRLSLYRPNKTNDYRFLDRNISEQLTVGGTDLYIHKYLGPETTPSADATQPEYDCIDPTQIQDLLFLENRDRKYDKNIYRLRGHYNTQNLDFDLSQFGLFLNNDIIFITIHYNDMIDIIGRKLMVGDVIELPHLLDQYPLDEKLEYSLKRYYQITDANYGSEGFSQTWFPHLWRIKCEQLVDSQEYKDILRQPVNQDNYLGDWNETDTYPPGYTITYGENIYKSIQEVPVNFAPPDYPEYWELVEGQSERDNQARYNTNIEINDAVIAQAYNDVPLSGYETENLFVQPTYGEFIENGEPSGPLHNEPAPAVDSVIPNVNYPPPCVVELRNPQYKNPSTGIKISKKTLEELWGMTDDLEAKLDAFIQTSLEIYEEAPTMTDTGSGPVDTNKLLSVQALCPVIGPYGTSDNTYATSDQDPDFFNFDGDEPYGTDTMGYVADTDPRFQFIRRHSARSFGYATGYLTGDGKAPNGYPVVAQIYFPDDPKVGDYCLRIDYAPQILFRWDGTRWVRINENVRTPTGKGGDDQSLISTFINNTAEIYINSERKFVPSKQGLSDVLRPKPDNLPPRECD